jgi:hypothetical protein
MLAIQGIYDGVATKPKVKEAVKIKQDDITERLAIAESLFGILPPTVTDEEVKKERMKRYERNY